MYMQSHISKTHGPWEMLLFHSQGSVQFSHSVVSDSLRPHESQHARPPCPSPSPGVHSDSYPSSRWCHPAISSSVVPLVAPYILSVLLSSVFWLERLICSCLITATLFCHCVFVLHMLSSFFVPRLLHYYLLLCLVAFFLVKHLDLFFISFYVYSRAISFVVSMGIRFNILKL